MSWFAAPPRTLRLGQPRWAASFAYGAVIALAVCYPVWPGFMHYDGALAWDQVSTGVQTMTWPPMHTYFFALSKFAGAGAGGLLAAQTFLLFFAAALAINLLVSGARAAAAAMAGFAVLFLVFPTMLGALVVHYRDTLTASFTLLGLALWLAAARGRSLALLVAAGLSISLAVSLRYNAFPLFVLLIPLMIHAPYLSPSPMRARAVLAAVLVVGLGLAWGASRWRLPDLAYVPKAAGFAGAQLFDLFGVSACAGRNFLPAAIAEGATVTPAQIRQAYDPRHLQITERPRPDLPRFFETDGDGEVQRAWRAVIPRHLGCYLAHRRAVFVEQMGLSRYGVFLPSHSTIPPTRDGLTLARPAAAAEVSNYIAQHANADWRRPAFLHAAAMVLALLTLLRHRPWAPLLLALLGGCVAFLGGLFIAAPAADARYIFPTNALSALICVVCAARLLSPAQEAAP